MTRSGTDSKGGFGRGDFARLAALEPRSFWFRSRNRLITWALRRYFPNAGSFLEVGCGTGFVLTALEREFPGWRLTGGELFPEGVRLASARLEHATLCQMDARSIPFSNAFDVVGIFDVLEHVPEDVQVLADLHCALRSRGGLLLTVPQHPFLWSEADDYAHHVRRYRHGELLAKVTSAGFSMIRCTSFISLPMPLLAASRVRYRRRGIFDPDAELALPPLVDRGLERVLNVERWLIRHGVRFPFGGSLLVAARKSS